MAALATITTHHLPPSSTFSKPLHKNPSLHFSITTTPRNLKLFCCLSSANRTDEDPPPSVSSRTSSSNDLRIMFAAGGTGGHIYPAVAIADELKLINPNIQILFVGNEKGMESTSVPSTGYDFVSYRSFPLARPLINPVNIIFPFRLIKSMIESWKIISDFKPQIVVGTGGYVSAPVCLSAALVRDIRLVIQEQNSVPGFANWVLSIFADRIFVAFPSSVRLYPKNKVVVSGNPIRLSLRQFVSKTVARLHFFPRAARTWNPESRVVLVLGGSLGANAINIAMLNMYYQTLLEEKKIFIIWQTGVEAFDEMESLVKSHPRLILTPFLHTMDLAYAAADLVVSRAGAMICSEILATGKPSILIPSPYAAEGHQMKNASLMVDLAGSKVITEDELDSTTLGNAMKEVLGDESLMAMMSEKALSSARPDAASEIAQNIVSLVKMSTSKR